MPINVDTGLIDFLVHPPLGVLSTFEDFYGPYSGNVSITHWSQTPGPIYTSRDVRDTFGVVIEIDGVIPSHWGHTSGYYSPGGEIQTDNYNPPFCELVVLHQLATTAYVVTQRHFMTMATEIYLWDIALPSQIGLHIAPNISVSLLFLLIQPPGP